jgi:hypothetical protein
MFSRVLVLWLVLGAACSAPPLKGKGGVCHSLSDCKSGLACIDGKCSTDLTSIAGEVPDYGAVDAGLADAGAADAGVRDAGVDAGGDGGGG